MILEHNFKKITWIDLENPSQDEVRQIAEKYNLDLLVADELLSPTARPKVDYYKNYIYLILQFPTTNKDSIDDHEKIQEIDFVIGKEFIITTRYNSIDGLLEFSKTFEVESILDRSDMSTHAGFVFFYMIRFLYKSMMNRLASTRDLLTDIENKIFSGHEKKMVMELSRINRLLLNYKESVNLHKEVLESFEIAGKNLFGDDFNYHLRSITGEYYKIQTEISGAKEYLDELRQTNDSLLSTKQNEIMKILTATTFLVLPLSLIAGLFSMNTLSTPIVGQKDDFLIIIIFMLLISSLTFIFFKLKKWL